MGEREDYDDRYPVSWLDQFWQRADAESLVYAAVFASPLVIGVGIVFWWACAR